MEKVPFRIIDGDSRIFVPENGQAQLKFRTVFDHGWPNLEPTTPDTWEADFLIPGISFADGVLTVSSNVDIETEHLVVIRARKGDQVDEIPVRVIKKRLSAEAPLQPLPLRPFDPSLSNALLDLKKRTKGGQPMTLAELTIAVDKVLDAVLAILGEEIS